MNPAVRMRRLHVQYVCVYVKVKQSLYRAGQACRSAGDGGFQNCRQSAHADGKFANPKNRPPLSPQDITLVFIPVRVTVDLRGHSATRRIKTVALSGTEPATFRLVAQCLNYISACTQFWVTHGFVTPISYQG